MTNEIYTLPLGSMGTNCYIIATENKNAVAVDIGDDFPKFKKFIEDRGLKLKKILLTHSHFDHVLGTEEARKTYDAEVFVHELDSWKLNDEEGCFCGLKYGMHFNPVTKFTEIKDSDIITQDELTFKVLHTPGHSAGSVCYICDDVIFSGDTLFCGSMGRTDFEDGSSEDILKSLKKLANLKGDYKVYPGHFQNTTLEAERKNNPYMKMAQKAGE